MFDMVTVSSVVSLIMCRNSSFITISKCYLNRVYFQSNVKQWSQTEQVSYLIMAQ